MATGGVVGGYVGNKVGGFLGSVYDWLSGISYSDSGPTDAPRGTRPIDQWGIGKGDIHDIKEGVGAGPTDWVGVTPGGEVITTGPNGEPVNNGHVGDYTNRPLKQFPR